MRREQALLDEHLAQARGAGRRCTARLQLLVGDDAEAIEDGAEAILVDVGGGGAHVAAAEVDGLARGAVDDGELTGPLLREDEVDDVDEAADGVDLAGERDAAGRDAADRRGGAAVGDALQDDDLAGGRHDAEAAGARGEAALRLGVELQAAVGLDEDDVAIAILGHVHSLSVKGGAPC